ncbi:MAG: hypothetical protein K8T91_20755 [Planctomycetes bacterium]|nr:hypothetical protein [Planctomycetota bacterium]
MNPDLSGTMECKRHGKQGTSRTVAMWGTSMKILIGAFIGLTTASLALVVVGFVLGGIFRAAPCHKAPDFMSGAIFGMFALTVMGIVPVGAGGAIIGAIVGVIFQLCYRGRIVCPGCGQRIPRKTVHCPNCEALSDGR